MFNVFEEIHSVNKCRWSEVKAIEDGRKKKQTEVTYMKNAKHWATLFSDLTNLNNIFFYLFLQESAGTAPGPPSTGASQQMQNSSPANRPPHAKEYSFLDIELKYGILQVEYVVIEYKCFWFDIF